MNWKRTLAFLVCLLSAGFFTTPALAGKSYHAEQFDVQMDLQQGGDMLVTETVSFRFDGGPFTYAFREVSASGTDGLTFLDASMDGIPMPQGTGAGQAEVSSDRRLKITWHFAPTSDATHVFVVRYRVAGAISTGKTDSLRWYVIPPDHGYSIDRASVTVNYPNGIQPVQAPALDRKFESSPSGNATRLTASNIADDDGVILTVGFPARNLVAAAPRWQAGQAARDAATARVIPIALFSGLGTLMLGVFGLAAYIRANRRELSLPPQNPTPYPPDESLSPALVGKLVGSSSTFMGTVFDLAQRGWLEVHEEKGFLGSKNLILERKSLRLQLTPHEENLLEAMFKSGETQVNLSEIGSRIANKSSQMDQQLEGELIQRSWLDPERKRKRSALLAIAVLGMAAAVVGAILGGAITGAWLTGNQPIAKVTAAIAGMCAGAFVLSILILIYASSLSALTPAGEEQKVRWNNFRGYLDQVSHGREPAIMAGTFERYLAYAAIFGLGTAWAKYFQKLGGVSLPTWYQTMAGSDGDFSAIVAVMAASDSASYSGGADGGGASGGGSSGAG